MGVRGSPKLTRFPPQVTDPHCNRLPLPKIFVLIAYMKTVVSRRTRRAQPEPQLRRRVRPGGAVV